MHYTDRIYKTIEISEPVLLDLLETVAMRRLQGVLQHGITGLLGITRNVSRLEHSLGVMILVHRLGASLDEQIAAMLHDVSHTAFSHVIDFVFNGPNGQSYHEEMKEPYIAASDIPDALARHGYDWRHFLQEENFPLLERDAPALCADRLDYFLRDAYDLGLATLDQVQNVLAHLVVVSGHIAVDDLNTALWMGETYLQADEASWANFREVGLYELTARAIRLGLQHRILRQEDLWTTDAQVWGRLQASSLPELQDALSSISVTTRFEWDAGQPTFWVGTKLRTIDPYVWVGGELRPLSARVPDFGHRRQEYLDRKAGKWPMKVITGQGEIQ